jgi:hypothetical protein
MKFDTREEAHARFDAYAASDGSSSDSSGSGSSREGSSGRTSGRSSKAATEPIPSFKPLSQDGGLLFNSAKSDKSKGVTGEVMGVKLILNYESGNKPVVNRLGRRNPTLSHQTTIITGAATA